MQKLSEVYPVINQLNDKKLPLDEFIERLQSIVGLDNVVAAIELPTQVCSGCGSHAHRVPLHSIEEAARISPRLHIKRQHNLNAGCLSLQESLNRVNEVDMRKRLQGDPLSDGLLQTLEEVRGLRCQTWVSPNQAQVA